MRPLELESDGVAEMGVLRSDCELEYTSGFLTSCVSACETATQAQRVSQELHKNGEGAMN